MPGAYDGCGGGDESGVAALRTESARLLVDPTNLTPYLKDWTWERRTRSPRIQKQFQGHHPALKHRTTHGLLALISAAIPLSAELCTKDNTTSDRVRW